MTILYPVGYGDELVSIDELAGKFELAAPVVERFAAAMGRAAIEMRPLTDYFMRRHAIERLGIPESDILRIDHLAGGPVLVMRNWRRVPLTPGGNR